MTAINTTHILLNESIKENAQQCLDKTPCDGLHEVIIREVSKDKTLKQLGAVFGVWIKYLAQENGESEDYYHKMLKAKFLARIYVTEPLNDAQEQWVELLAHYQYVGERDKLKKHAKRISLQWAKLKQMKEYMNVIEQHYIAEGKPLPVIDPYWRGQ